MTLVIVPVQIVLVLYCAVQGTVLIDLHFLFHATFSQNLRHPPNSIREVFGNNEWYIKFQVHPPLMRNTIQSNLRLQNANDDPKGQNYK